MGRPFSSGVSVAPVILDDVVDSYPIAREPGPTDEHALVIILALAVSVLSARLLQFLPQFCFSTLFARSRHVSSPASLKVG